MKDITPTFAGFTTRSLPTQNHLIELLAEIIGSTANHNAIVQDVSCFVSIRTVANTDEYLL